MGFRRGLVGVVVVVTVTAAILKIMAGYRRSLPFLTGTLVALV